MSKYKQVIVILGVIIFVMPQIALAAWWNPFSWSVWNIFKPTPKVELIQVANNTQATSTSVATTTKSKEKNIINEKPKENTVQKRDTVPPASSCTQDIWSCSDWLACSNSGSQTRSCNKIFECPLVVTQSPITSQSCTPPAPTCQEDTWSCGDWSPCSTSGNQTRSCTKTFDCSSISTPSPTRTQSCTPPITNVITPPVYTPPAPPVLPTCTITPDVSFNDNQNITLHNSQTGYFSAVFDFSSPECWAEKVIVSDSVSSASGYLSFTNGYALFSKFSRATGKPCYWLSKFEGTNGSGAITSREGAKSGCSAGSPDKWYLNVEVLKDTPAGTKVGICVLSAEDGNGLPIKGLPYCTKTWTVE